MNCRDGKDKQQYTIAAEYIEITIEVTVDVDSRTGGDALYGRRPVATRHKASYLYQFGHNTAGVDNTRAERVQAKAARLV